MRFPNSMPRFKTRCCCVDCLERLTWCQKQGGPKLPKELVERRVPPTLLYMDNQFEVLKGLENLEVCKLRADQATRNCIATCCHTHMLCEAPPYNGNCVSSFPDACSWLGVEASSLQLYSFVGDWDPAEYPKLEPKLPGIYQDHSAPSEKQPTFVFTEPGSLRPAASSEAGNMKGELPQAVMDFGAAFDLPLPPCEDPGCIQFDDLPGAGAPRVLGLEESRDSMSKRVNNHFAATAGA